MLSGAAVVATGTGSAPIWVAGIGALSLVAGALIPELFKALRPRIPDPPPVVVSVEDFRKLSERVAGVAATQGTILGEVRGVKREQRAVREAAEDRDRTHVSSLEAIRDEVQRHLWGDHGYDRRRTAATTGPQPIVPPPRGEPA